MAKVESLNLSRRRFLRAKTHQQSTQFRLPWSISENHFSSHCSRCEQCVSSCETGIIAIDSDGLPFLDFKKGECTFCGACVEACPEPLFDNVRQQPLQGYLNIKETCLAKQQIFCQSCADSCDTQAIGFFYNTAIPEPVVEQSDCTHCGACISVCPTGATELIQRQEPS
ncbi:ferredoxin-type protein NapF [Thalassotalea mangrovi]|uniref:Ferredoxin-type protein NapF n=1 Tax=Thalassotalea mangrovi TaxID=2572245 RepID=A0A4V6WMM1_9GAMM|nr:ferredoxin-type protein NapF [Thalassotalea mangrovi]TKB47402.1 ferredoxin-type protein NapF [Thalassotalea mangrovi]